MQLLNRRSLRNFFSNYYPDDRDSVRKKPFNCFDININDRIICAGTEQGDQEAYLLFFDIRKQTLLGAYWDRLLSTALSDENILI